MDAGVTGHGFAIFAENITYEERNKLIPHETKHSEPSVPPEAPGSINADVFILNR